MPSRETIVNNALEQAGLPMRIQSLWDGSHEAVVARDLWATTRDETLRAKRWTFARTIVELTPSAFPASNPWLFRWNYPPASLTIELLDVYGGHDVSDFSIVPSRWAFIHTATEGTDIMTDYDAARAVITTRIIDPALWIREFVEAMTAAMALRLLTALGGGNETSGRGEQRARANRAQDQNSRAV